MSEGFEPKLVVLVVPAHCTVGGGTRTEALVIYLGQYLVLWRVRGRLLRGPGRRRSRPPSTR